MTTIVSGKVYLVGAGPGDPELLTLKGKKCLERADVVLFDRLIDGALLSYAPPMAERIYVGKEPGKHCADQKEIERVMIERARKEKTVVRLKGGDPFVFGRGGEEAQALKHAGIPFEVVPGVSSAVAVPAYAGIPLTHRDFASSVAIVTGHRTPRGGGNVNWRALARGVDTLVILMGLRHLRHIMDELLAAGCEPDRAVAIVQLGKEGACRKLVGTVGTISELTERAGFEPPAVIVVGAVARLSAALDRLVKARSDGLELDNDLKPGQESPFPV